MQTETVFAEDSYISALSWNVLAHIAKKASRSKNRFAIVKMRELAKLTDCYELKFLDCALGRLIVAGVIIPAYEERGESQYRCDGFIVPDVKHSQPPKMTPESFDEQFLKACGIAVA